MLVCTCGFRTSMNCRISFEQNQLRLEYSSRLPKEDTDLLCLLGKISNLSRTCVLASMYHICRVYIYIFALDTRHLHLFILYIKFKWYNYMI